MNLNHRANTAPPKQAVFRTLHLTAAVVFLCTGRPARAYEASFVHPWLTREAVNYLLATHPDPYRDLANHLPSLEAGAEHEDDLFLDNDRDPLTARSGRHFYRPTDGAGLTMGETSYVSSYTWGAKANPGNEWDWFDALDAYRAGDQPEAYFALGHVLHLLQDLTVPAHVHLDVHGPPAGDDYENYTWFRTPSPLVSSLPAPSAGATLPVFDNLDAAWERTATATYWRSMVSGDLTFHDNPSGNIVEMFPEIQWSWFSQEWTIDTPPVGALGVDFFEELPGWFYFKDTEQAATVTPFGFDADLPHQLTLQPNTDGQHLAHALAQDLVPLAIVTSAAVIALFVRDAALLEPKKTTGGGRKPPSQANGCRASAVHPVLLLTFVALLLPCRRRRS